MTIKRDKEGKGKIKHVFGGEMDVSKFMDMFVCFF